MGSGSAPQSRVTQNLSFRSDAQIKPAKADGFLVQTESLDRATLGPSYAGMKRMMNSESITRSASLKSRSDRNA